MLIAGALTASGCASQPDEWFHGTWTVTEATFAPVSALSVDDAEQWFGKQLDYSPGQVRFESEQCTTPTFSTEMLSAFEFYAAYRMSFDALQINGAEVEVLRVGCPHQWISPGSTLIKVDDSSAYILWDGVFFKVIRNSPTKLA